LICAARCYQFAGRSLPPTASSSTEVLYLGTLLHDIGLSPAADGIERFEVRGANLVRALLLDHGMERARVANVWTASRCTPRPRSPATRALRRATRTAASRSTCAAQAPTCSNRRWSARCSTAGRGTFFPASSRRCLADGVRAHPDSVRLSWLESVAAVHVPGFVPTDFLAGLRAPEGFA
jgi:hypothetical protein